MNTTQPVHQIHDLCRFAHYVLDHMADSAFWLRSDGQIVYANRSAAKSLGYTKDELLGLKVFDVHTDFDESDWANYWAKIKKQTSLVFESEHRRKSGEIFRVEIHATYVQFEEVEYICGIVHEITKRKMVEEELKISEEKYHASFADSPDAYLINIDGFFVDCNKAAEMMLRGSRSQIIGQTAASISPEFQPDGRRSKDAIEVLRKSTLKSEKSTFEWVHRRFDGTDFIVEICITSIRINGKPALFNTWRDITDRKNAENMLRQSELRLKELNATKDRFFSIIAHDLKSPFNSIIGFSNLLADQVREHDYEGIEKYAEIIQQSSYRAMNLLKNLLDWSRVQTGRIEFNPEYIELVHQIHEVTGLMSDTAQHKSITITNKLPHNAPVFADHAMINTILRNLLSNAIKFTEPGGAVSISVKENHDDIEVAIRDTGRGMKKEALQKLFKIDESYSTPDTNNERGTGLGLILCYEFIKQHHGKIWAKSEAGKGSIFYFSLPKK